MTYYTLSTSNEPVLCSKDDWKDRNIIKKDKNIITYFTGLGDKIAEGGMFETQNLKTGTIQRSNTYEEAMEIHQIAIDTLCNNRLLRYKLGSDGKTPRRCSDEEWYESWENRRIALDGEVSTIFVGLNHNLFETCNRTNYDKMYYSNTYDEAMIIHKKLLSSDLTIDEDDNF